MSARVEWVTDATRFAAVRSEWDRLARGPFQRHGWFEAWREAFAGTSQLAVALVWRDEELVAALPACRDRHGLRAMANVHSPKFEPLGRDPASVDDVLDTVLSTGAGEVRMTSLPEEGGALDRCVERCRRAARAPLVEPRWVSPLTDTSGDWEKYRGERKWRWREVERRRRRLAREYAPRITLVTRPSDLQAEIERALRLEASGWKGRRGTAILSSKDTRGFYRSVAREFHGRGELVMSTVEVKGHLLACDLALLADERYWLLKTAYDEDWRSLAPGLVLRHHVIEYCFQHGIRAHEFLGDAMAWKQSFATGERAHAELFAYRARPVPFVSYCHRRFLRPALARGYHRLRPPRVARAGAA